MLCLLTACAPAIEKARFDITAQDAITWPGTPEKPRIKYLWALQQVGNADSKDQNSLERIVAGSEKEELQRTNILLRPQAVYVDEKRYYIADPGAMRVTIIERQSLDVMHITYARADSLEYPIGVVADTQGNIYVSDPELKKIIAYTAQGSFLHFFEGEIVRPTGLAIDRSRNIVYVADSLGHAVHIYGTDGKRKGTFGKRGEGDGEFNFPGHLFVDQQGRLYVTDFLNFRVQIFAPDGKFLKKFGSVGDSHAALDKPKGVAIDTEGNIYVVDAGRDMVKIFDQEGRSLLFFGEKGHGYGQFYLPTGIFVDARNIIYVADTINMRIQAFRFLGGN
ncbi:MAG: hypothetical protein C0402_11185 [Thermodesulfovibrio sp.]|nr:hypothetical protein [Thermodesulfovibrio sp.]